MELSHSVDVAHPAHAVRDTYITPYHATGIVPDVIVALLIVAIVTAAGVVAIVPIVILIIIHVIFSDFVVFHLHAYVMCVLVLWSWTAPSAND